uniref:Uncharacterized protein n=1 Tax=Anguilla anguilla TaxID=7936 RepID=A0A0E9V6Q1_ANGAN
MLSKRAVLSIHRFLRAFWLSVCRHCICYSSTTPPILKPLKRANSLISISQST